MLKRLKGTAARTARIRPPQFVAQATYTPPGSYDRLAVYRQRVEDDETVFAEEDVTLFNSSDEHFSPARKPTCANNRDVRLEWVRDEELVNPDNGEAVEAD